MELDKTNQDQEVTITSDEWFEEEEYVNSDNDPEKVLIVPEDEYVISDNEEIVEFDEIFEYVRAKITDFTNQDKMLEEKLLDVLRNGELK